MGVSREGGIGPRAPLQTDFLSLLVFYILFLEVSHVNKEFYFRGGK